MIINKNNGGQKALSYTRSRGIRGALQAIMAKAFSEGKHGHRQVCIEFFSGAGGLSAALREKGEAVISFDISLGRHFDLNNMVVRSVVSGWFKSRLVRLAWFGTPCNSWSRARRGPPGGRYPCALRDKDNINGLSLLSSKDLAKVVAANSLAKYVGYLLRLCLRWNNPAGEENPASSFLWLMPSRQHLCKFAKEYVVDYCACSTPYRARTRLRLFGCAASCLLGSMMCHGRGVCDFSGQKHLQLSGAEKGMFRTVRKDAYPRKLCLTLAALLVQAASDRRAAALWAVFKGSLPEHS
jgi:hypothetical protein